MLFALLNSLEFPCPRTHHLHVRKLAAGFVQRGYQYIEIAKSDEAAHLADCDVLYISNHFTVDPLHRPFRSLLEKRLEKLLRGVKAKIIFWNFHTLSDWNIGNKVASVHLGEDIYPEQVAVEPALARFRETFRVHCLRYASPLHPDFAPEPSECREVAFNFIGHGYRKDLTEYCATRYSAIIRNTPPTVPEGLRVNSFKRAEINLVFHAETNKRKGIIVERFAEALSYGGLIIHDHPRIAAEFGDLKSLFFATSPAEIDSVYAHVQSLSEADRLDLRRASIERWRSSGLSYFAQAGRILEKFL